MEQEDKEKLLDANVEGKAKFFALYLEQEVMHFNNINHTYPVLFTASDYIESCYLELKHLKNITDEEAIQLARISITYAYHPEFKVYKNSFGKPVVSWGDSHHEKYMVETEYGMINYNTAQTDYLRSKGYAMPYLGYRVSDLVLKGWVKIKEQNDK